MPKTKDLEPKKKIILTEEEEKEADPELIPGTPEDEELDEEGNVIDDEEVDPFGDKWEQ